MSLDSSAWSVLDETSLDLSVLIGESHIFDSSTTISFDYLSTEYMNYVLATIPIIQPNTHYTYSFCLRLDIGDSSQDLNGWGIEVGIMQNELPYEKFTDT